jgi:hypothetical protein
VQVPARALRQPVVHEARLVGPQVVEHEVHVQAGRHGRLDPVQEGAELHAAVPPLAGADHRAGPHVERGEEVQRAVAAPVVGPPLGLPGPQGDRRGRALRRAVPCAAWICWGGWPPHGIAVPRWWPSKVTNGEPSAMEVATIGLDLAKHVFPVHGLDAAGNAALIPGPGKGDSRGIPRPAVF